MTRLIQCYGVVQGIYNNDEKIKNVQEPQRGRVPRIPSVSLVYYNTNLSPAKPYLGQGPSSLWAGVNDNFYEGYFLPNLSCSLL